MSNEFIYNGHLCFHELLHRKLDGKSYDNSENTVGYIKENVSRVDEITVYINFFNIAEVFSHMNMAPIDFPNIKTIHIRYAIEPEFDPAYASPKSIYKFNELVERCKRLTNEYNINCYVDTRLMKLKRKKIPFDHFCRIISKMGSLYWVEDNLNFFDFNINENEYVQSILSENDVICWPWYDALKLDYPDFSWDTYKFIIQENLKPFDAFEKHPPEFRTKED